MATDEARTRPALSTSPSGGVARGAMEEPRHDWQRAPTRTCRKRVPKIDPFLDLNERLSALRRRHGELLLAPLHNLLGWNGASYGLEFGVVRSLVPALDRTRAPFWGESFGQITDNTQIIRSGQLSIRIRIPADITRCFAQLHLHLRPSPFWIWSVFEEPPPKPVSSLVLAAHTLWRSNAPFLSPFDHCNTYMYTHTRQHLAAAAQPESCPEQRRNTYLECKRRPRSPNPRDLTR